MADPIRVIVRRGGVVEATHLVHAAAVRDGSTVAQAGNPQLVTLLRSSAKPFQALPLARAYDDLDPRELAIASASHLADRAQLEAVRMLLARAHAGEDDLECGPVGQPPSRLAETREGKRVADAMRAHPELIRGRDAPDTMLMKTVPGAVAKGGAEGLLCGSLPDGTGFALKSADGSARALRSALASFAASLALELPGFAEVPLANSRGEAVGTIAVE